jgi:hypothetical protein
VTDSSALPTETQLEILLRELLERDASATAAPAELEFSREIVELRDMARLLRAASQWVPLPEGRTAVRRALLAAARERAAKEPAPAAWRRTSRWLAAAGMAMMLMMAVGLGTGLPHVLGSPAGPLYSLRLQMDAARVALAPTAVRKAEVLVRAAHMRITEIDEMVAAGNTPGMRRAAAALDYEAEWLHSITSGLSLVDQHRFEGALER